MSLIPPGKRGNKFWYARVQVNGQRVEVSTETTDKGAARRFEAELKAKLLRNERVGDDVMFAVAADLYMNAKLSEDSYDRVVIERIKKLLPKRLVGSIVQNDLVDCAKILYPDCMPSTWNRWIVKPISAIVNYAAKNKWCSRAEFERFEEDEPVTRAVSMETAARIVSTPMKRDQFVLVLWLFRLGTRITDSLKALWENLDFRARTIQMRIGKKRKWRKFPIASDLFSELLRHCFFATAILICGAKRSYQFRRYRDTQERIFTWGSKGNVYDWLNPIMRAAGIRFTPHMARHSVGTWLNAQGAGQRTIMSALDHSDLRSSARYQDVDIELLRAEGEKIGQLLKSGGRNGGKSE